MKHSSPARLRKRENTQVKVDTVNQTQLKETEE